MTARIEWWAYCLWTNLVIRMRAYTYQYMRRLIPRPEAICPTAYSIIYHDLCEAFINHTHIFCKLITGRKTTRRKYFSHVSCSYRCSRCPSNLWSSMFEQGELVCSPWRPLAQQRSAQELVLDASWCQPHYTNAKAETRPTVTWHTSNRHRPSTKPVSQSRGNKDENYSYSLGGHILLARMSRQRSNQHWCCRRWHMECQYWEETLTLTTWKQQQRRERRRDASFWDVIWDLKRI